MSALGPTTGVKTRKSSVSANSFSVCPRKQTYLPILELLPPPALSERRHCGLACRRVAVRRPVVIKQHRPPPWHPRRRRVGLEDAADHDAISKHVEVIVVPLARRPACCGALE